MFGHNKPLPTLSPSQCPVHLTHTPPQPPVCDPAGWVGPGQAQSPSETPKQTEAARPPPERWGHFHSATWGMREDSGLGEGRTLGSLPVYLRVPQALQGPPNSAFSLLLPRVSSSHSLEASQHLAGTGGDLEVGVVLPSQVCASELSKLAHFEREILRFPSGRAIKVRLHSEEKKKSFRGAVPHRRHKFTCSTEGRTAPSKSTLVLVPRAWWAACLSGEPSALLMPVGLNWMGHCSQRTAIMQTLIYLLR